MDEAPNDEDIDDEGDDLPEIPKERLRDWPWTWVAVIAGLLVIVVAAAVMWPQSASDTSTARISSPLTRSVVYRVTGSALSADLTLTNSTGNTEQISVNVPLKSRSGTEGLRFEVLPGQHLYLSAQNQGRRGSITCEIEVDGIVVERATSSGAYKIASCSGRS